MNLTYGHEPTVYGRKQVERFIPNQNYEVCFKYKKNRLISKRITK